MKIKAKDVKKLRKKTQSGYMNCKEALIEANGDLEEAQEILRRKGFKLMENSSSDQTEQGVICSYIHPGNRIGVLVEVKCKTDFVAKTEEFKTFAREMAMQVASMKPDYISRADVPLEKISQEVGYRTERLIREDAYGDESFQAKLDGEMNQWYSEMCLLEQPYIRDNRRAVKNFLADLITKVDEPCRITRFERWEIESESEEKEENIVELEAPRYGKKLQIFSIIILFALFSVTMAMIFGIC